MSLSDEFDNAAGDDVAHLVLDDVLIDAGGDELLHRELDLALFRVDGQDLRLDDLAGAQGVAGVVETAVGHDLADVDQAFDAIGNLNESAKAHELGDRAFNCAPTGKLRCDLEPGVGEGLLEAERDAPLFGLDGENDCVDAVAVLEQVAGMANLLAPGHFRDMDEAFNAGLDFDKGPEIHEAGDGAGDALASDEALRCGFPGLSLELFEAERDFLCVRIDLVPGVRVSRHSGALRIDR